MDGGLNVSTAQAIAALVFLVATIGTLLGIIRGLYVRQIERLEERIERLEDRDERRSALIERTLDNLGRTAEQLDRQVGVTEAALARPARRRTGGSD